MEDSFNHDSWIVSGKYNDETKRLLVTTQRGDQYELQGVPLEVWQEFKQAPSKGQYFNLYLKGQYNHELFD